AGAHIAGGFARFVADRIGQRKAWLRTHGHSLSRKSYTRLRHKGMDDTGTFHDKTDDPARAAKILTKRRRAAWQATRRAIGED
ncbi:MAG: hypothetical protein ABJ117_00565, partial [Alphaproteobacteria bacterium]